MRMSTFFSINVIEYVKIETNCDQIGHWCVVCATHWVNTEENTGELKVFVDRGFEGGRPIRLDSRFGIDTL